MFIKVAVETLQPLTLVATRLLIGCVGLLIVVRQRGLTLPGDGRTWRHLLVVGVVNVALPFVLITWAESGPGGLDSGIASILNSTVPLFSILLAGFLLRMETVTRGTVLGIVTGFVGVVLLFSQDGLTQLAQLAPYLAVTLAAVGYAAGTVYARRNLSGVQPVLLATGQLLVAAFFVVAAAFLFEDLGQQSFTWPALLSVLWLGLLGSCLAYILYFYVLQEWGATRTTLVTYLIPVVGVAAGVLVLGERLDWRTVLGAILILSGVGLVNWRPGRGRAGLR